MYCAYSIADQICTVNAFLGDFMIFFSDRLKSLRNSRHLTQSQVGAAINIAESAYRRYELGMVSPRLEMLIALADYFDVSIDYLVGRTDNPDVNK